MLDGMDLTIEDIVMNFLRLHPASKFTIRNLRHTLRLDIIESRGSIKSISARIRRILELHPNEIEIDYNPRRIAYGWKT